MGGVTVRTWIKTALRFLGDYVFWFLAAVAILVAAWVYCGWEYFAEVTIRDGRVYEVKTDLARIAQQVGVLILAIPALFLAVWRTWTAHQQADVARQQLALAERGQNIERFAKGAQLLESESIGVRQAGIYALTELAAVDPDRSGPVVVKLLGAFIRANRRLPEQEEEPTPTEDVADAFDGIGSIRAVTPSLPIASLQGAVVTVTTFKGLNFGNEMLRGAWLADVNFEDCTFSKAVISDAILDGASFTDCNLEEADFSSSVLTEARFVRCDLSFARFSGANLTAADLVRCDVTQANFSSAAGVSERTFQDCRALRERPPRGVSRPIIEKLARIG